MYVGIISDIHDNLWNLGPTIAWLNGNTEVLICCGDLCSPFVMDELRKYRGPVHIVFGNNDADLFRITKKCDARLQVHGELALLELDGRRIAVNHFDYIARPMAQCGLYDLVCFGHNHRISGELFGKTLAVNPGPVMGAAFTPSGWEEVPVTWAVYDTKGSSVQPYRLLDRSRVAAFTASGTFRSEQ